MRFEEYSISEVIKQNLADMGFNRPTDIQFKSIPPILRGEDVLAIAQTGTGKTAAFAIPVIHLLHERKRKVRKQGIQCIVMVPTRELALQITRVFNNIERGTRVTSISLYGGVEQDPQIQKLLQGVDILITTPGRMFDLNHQGFIHLENTSIVILDEADHMLDLGFIQDIRDLSKHLPAKRQTLFFSATINDHIKSLAYSLVTNPIRIQIAPKDRVSKNIDHSKFFVAADEKRFFLERIVKEHPEKKILIFVRTKVRAERVAKAMTRVGIETITIHGDKDQKDRIDVLQKFRTGVNKIMIATDVSARGIDIPNVDYVVNYDLPDVAENYVHRVGRTGRGTHHGIAISFCSEEENDLLAEIEKFLTKPIVEMKIDLTDYKKTIDFTDDATTHNLKELLKEVEEFEDFQKKKARKKKKQIMQPVTFSARIELLTHMSHMHAIILPPSIIHHIGRNFNVRLLVTLQETLQFQGGVVSLGNGQGYISLTKNRMKTLGLKTDMIVTVRLELDQSTYGLPICEEMQTILDFDEEGSRRFHQLTAGKQRTIIHYVGLVKSSQLRIERALMYIENLKRLPEGKEPLSGIFGR